VGISLVSQRAPVERWARRYGLGATLALVDGDLFEALGVGAAPSTVFVRGGRIVGRSEHVVPGRFLLRHTAALAR
jgi:hypothetical protein